MKKIIIVCAGSFGREARSAIREYNRQADQHGTERPYQLLGFIDDNLNALDGTGVDDPILGPIDQWKPIGDEYYVFGTASSAVKEKLSTKLKAVGCRFETLIAPWSQVSEDCEIGEGCFITAHSICAGVKIGNFVNVNGSLLAPGAVIGDFSTVTGFTVVEDATVGKRVFIGSHAVVTPGVHVGDDAQIGVGSIVCEDVRPGATVFGVPAEEIQ